VKARSVQPGLPDLTEAWHRVHVVIDVLTPETASIPGYYSEGWTAKDAVAHLGTWMAEGAAVLRQLAAGTYREGELNVDAANARFLEAMRDVPLEMVHLQAAAAHTELLRAWTELPEVSPASEFWVRKAGPEHLEEHVPELEAWVERLTS
jgi:Mycothiol maleylpyruvate isomerase N-terminal domain